MAYGKPVAFGIKCDKCGKDLVYKGSKFFYSRNDADNIAINKLGWSVIDGVHLCRECTTFVSKDKSSIISYQIY